jgi:hypothetical protein
MACNQNKHKDLSRCILSSILGPHILSALLFPPPPIGDTTTIGPGPPHYRGFTVTLRHTTLGRTPLDEGSARRRDLYLTNHNTHKRQTSMPPAGFEPTIPASERPQTHALDGAAAGIGSLALYAVKCYMFHRCTWQLLILINDSLLRSRTVIGFELQGDQPSARKKGNTFIIIRVVLSAPYLRKETLTLSDVACFSPCRDNYSHADFAYRVQNFTLTSACFNLYTEPCLIQLYFVWVFFPTENSIKIVTISNYLLFPKFGQPMAGYPLSLPD